jgi:hypothetical protein
MEIKAVLLTLIFTAIFTVIIIFVARRFLYNYISINPVRMTQCPDRWNFNSLTNMCEAAYKTTCFPFNPSAATLNSVSAKCNLARTCGTDWSGVCG